MPGWVGVEHSRNDVDFQARGRKPPHTKSRHSTTFVLCLTQIYVSRKSFLFFGLSASRDFDVKHSFCVNFMLFLMAAPDLSGG